MESIMPITQVGVNLMGAFDFPRPQQPATPARPLLVHPPNTHSNVPSGYDAHTATERWYAPAGFGTPQRRQGWAAVYESGAPEPEDVDDPTIPPYTLNSRPDLMIDFDYEICIDHTGRFSGLMVQLIDDGNHEFRIQAWAHPLNQPNPAPILLNPATPWTVINGQGNPPAANTWYYFQANELVYTLPLVVPPANLLAEMNLPGIYRLVIDWEFRHTAAGGGVPHYEPFGGFDANTIFRIGHPTTID